MDEIKIEFYSREQYLMGSEPYAFLYRYREDSFTRERLLSILSDRAKEVGVKNFRTLYKRYCETKDRERLYHTAGVGRTAFTGQPIALDSAGWLADDSGIVTCTPYGDMVACVHPLLPIQRLVDIDTGAEKLKLAYRRGSNWRTAIFDRRTLASASSIIALADVGIAVNSENARFLVRYLHDVENANYDTIPAQNSVGRLGWIEGKGFSPYVEDLVFDGDSNFKAFFDSAAARGEDALWLSMAKKVRQKSLTGRLILAASFASVLVGPMGCLPFFVHLWGATEAGKTVGLMLAASVWGSPETGKFIHTFNSTAVGREKSAAFVNSLPLILDELQIVEDRRQFDRDIYMLCEGAGKTRGNRTGGLDSTPTWHNCILTSGEEPITGAASGGGAVNRIVEVECREKIFENPRHVADTVRQNYGFAGRKFVEWLQEEGNMELARKAYGVYLDAFSKEDTTEKQSMAISLILAADLLVSEMLFEDGRNLTVGEVLSFLKTKKEVSSQERGYEYLLEYAAMNKRRFDIRAENNELWGDCDANYFYIVRSQFGKICQEAGYNPQSLLSWMKRTGKIEVSKGCTKAKRINGEVVNCVWLKKPDTLGSTVMEEAGEEDEDNPF